MNIKIKENVHLAPYTAFKIGGPAKFFCEVQDEETFLEALDYAKENNLAIFILGGGNNILVSDDGFSGLVIRMLNTLYLLHNASLECGAGLSLSETVNLARDNSLTGLEWAAGIPGTIGGAIRGNAGAYGSDMKNIVKSVKAIELPNHKITEFKEAECLFEYRNSIFKKNPNLIIFSAVLELAKGDAEAISSKMRQIIKKRAGKIPQKPSAGSIFKNPIVKKDEIIDCYLKDGGKMDENRLPAGWLIEEAGLKGKKIGGAAISDEHANMIVNDGGATAQDVVSLISFIKMKIRDAYGVELKEEVQYVGF